MKLEIEMENILWTSSEWNLVYILLLKWLDNEKRLYWKKALAYLNLIKVFNIYEFREEAKSLQKTCDNAYLKMKLEKKLKKDLRRKRRLKKKESLVWIKDTDSGEVKKKKLKIRLKKKANEKFRLKWS